MKIKVNKTEKMTLEEFTKKYNLNVIIDEYSFYVKEKTNDNFSASIYELYLREPGRFLSTVSGSGISMEQAVADLIKKISGKIVNIHHNKNITVPELIGVGQVIFKEKK